MIKLKKNKNEKFNLTYNEASVEITDKPLARLYMYKSNTYAIKHNNQFRWAFLKRTRVPLYQKAAI